jgi:hypothetical protein
MKRLLLICVISLLFVSGWNHVLAAAFCPNMQDMPGCHMQKAPASASQHEGHEGMEMGDMQMPPNATESNVGALERPLASCCASRPEVPPAPAIASRGAEQSRQDLGAIPKPALKAITQPTPSFAPPITSRQHAPPGTATARHVLISVFLI